MSRSQKYFDYLESKGKMPKKVDKYAHGGEVEDENYDEEMGEASEYDSSGEPHSEDELEEDEPKEYMAKGGMVKKMSRGGKVNPRFAKALSKAR